MPKTMRELAEEFAEGAGTLDTFVKDLLTLFSECVDATEKKYWDEVRKLGANSKGYLDAYDEANIVSKVKPEINSAINERSGICDKEK